MYINHNKKLTLFVKLSSWISSYRPISLEIVDNIKIFSQQIFSIENVSRVITPYILADTNVVKKVW